MPDLAGRGPLGPKAEKARSDPKYLDLIRAGKCCVCEAFGEIQIGPTFAHHTICGRYGSEKTPDSDAIGLCHAHHQGWKGIHTNKASWVQEYGDDRDYIAATRTKLGR